ncbi:carbamoyltransferase C-terminal domain-containing protein [Bacteroides heparinolyticus]|uniref:carbamoyltransferase C-terminal domain-containing protein n=2 Tax=Prevotella heparinolytica TaxID=28113 RepID=UPI0035A00627
MVTYILPKILPWIFILFRCPTSFYNLRVNYAIRKTGIKNVCVAGGIFMNCKMNMVVRENANLKDYFVQPLAGDMGLVIGAGLLASSINNVSELSLDLGPEYKDEEIEMALKNARLTYSKEDNIALSVANMLAEQKIVCWFEGRMESGARALGSRSILADPRTIEMSDKINERVKHREVWRPFACSVIEEYGEDIFENYKIGSSYPYMIEAFKVKEKWINRIPAVIHKADKTSRPQTVSKKKKPLYYAMIDQFRKLTGCPLVLNTSFNDKGQPIVMTPKLAIDFLINNQVDALAIGNFLVYKNR